MQRGALRTALRCAVVASATALAPRNPVALGLVKYAHNACVAVVDAESGALLFAGERERFSRVKNDGGCVGDVARRALETCGRTLDDVVSVVSNDHHRSVASTEAACARAARLGTSCLVDAEDAADPFNSYDQIETECSHHRAHALGAAATFGEAENGIVVVWDGMGDEARRFRGGAKARWRDDADDGVHYLGDARVLFQDIPDGARECETVYRETADGLSPLFKRWCVSPQSSADLFNYADWFDAPLDSLGAAYSFVSHVVFGDWNACGKVMGLAPWGSPEEHVDAGWGSKTHATWAPRARLAAAKVFADRDRPRLYSGSVWPNDDDESGLRVDRRAALKILEAAAAALERRDLAFANKDNWRAARDDDDARACCAVLAHAAQRDLEAVALPFAAKAASRKPERVVLCGGVALNSCLNGKVEAALTNVVVPPAPGDEGCALGCAVAALAALDTRVPEAGWGASLPFGGAAPSTDDVREAREAFADWIAFEDVDDEALIATCAEAVAEEEGLVFWYDGRSEFGPRALGHRSIIAPATKADVVDEINRVVKGREDFRPLAPAILEEEAAAFFEGGTWGYAPSPYMARVWRLTKEAANLAPACCHADRTARPQTVSKDETSISRYRRLVELVFQKTKCPCVLNTSFNTKPAEPIVESPTGACASFAEAASRGVDSSYRLLLVFPGVLGVPKDCPVNETTGDCDDASSLFPTRRHDEWTLSSSSTSDGASSLKLVLADLDEPDEDGSRTGRGVVSLTDDLEAAIYEACDGSASARDIAEALVAENSEDDPVSFRDVYLRMARLWRKTLVTLG